MVALLVKVGNQTMLNFHHSLVKTAKLWSNEQPEISLSVWWACQDSNLGPRDYESPALTS